MQRKIRKDILIKNLVKKLELKYGAIRNADGSLPRPNKQLGELIIEYKNAKINYAKECNSKDRSKSRK